MSQGAFFPSGRSLVQTIRRLAAWHPEWWMLAVSAGCWGLLLDQNHTADCCTWGMPGPNGGAPDWVRGLSSWLVMVLAMMLPLMLIPARAAAFGSLWRRRHWAIGTFLASYVAVWMVAGAATLCLLLVLREKHATEEGWVIAAGFLAAAIWQSTTLKRRLAAACHRTRPLAPSGWPAHRDCLLLGADHGLHCVGNCGVLMFAAMLSPWHRTLMVVVTGLLLYERYRVRPSQRALQWTLALLAIGHLV